MDRRNLQDRFARRSQRRLRGLWLAFPVVLMLSAVLAGFSHPSEPVIRSISNLQLPTPKRSFVERFSLSAVEVGCCELGVDAFFHTPSEPAQKPPAVPSGGATTAALYKKHCHLCHLDGDSPLEPMNFVDSKWAHGSRLNDIVKIVRDGVPDTAMIAFKDILTPQEIRAVAEYVRALDKSLKPEK